MRLGREASRKAGGPAAAHYFFRCAWICPPHHHMSILQASNLFLVLREAGTQLLVRLPSHCVVQLPGLVSAVLDTRPYLCSPAAAPLSDVFLAALPRCGDAALNVWSRVLNFTTLQVHQNMSPTLLWEASASCLANLMCCSLLFRGN